MSQNENVKVAAVSFHPVAFDASGQPIYRVGKQLRKKVAVDGTVVAELRWSKTKAGWTWALAQAGKIVRAGAPTKSRDQRDPTMMAAARALAVLVDEVAAEEAAA